MLDEDIFDDLFHGCALAAYLDQAVLDQQWPPDLNRTRRRANAYYEEELRRRKSG